jgi:hypothetical protein
LVKQNKTAWIARSSNSRIEHMSYMEPDENCQ